MTTKQTAQHTPGPVHVGSPKGASYPLDESGEPPRVWASDKASVALVATRRRLGEGVSKEEMANASLIAEAFNVATETSLTPRQLAEQRAELLAALQQIANFSPGSVLQPALVARAVLEKHGQPWLSAAIAKAEGK